MATPRARTRGFLKRAWLPILIGGLALLAFLWNGTEDERRTLPDDDAPKGQKPAAEPGLRGSEGAAAAGAVVPSFAVRIVTPDDRPVRWQLRMNVETGWRAKRTGQGSSTVRIPQVPDRPLWLALWAEGRPDLLVVERRIASAALVTGPLELRLAPAGRLHGKVQDLAGEPIAGAHIEVARRQPRDRPRWAIAVDLPAPTATRTTTDAGGAFAVSGLDLGTYAVQARHFDYCPQTKRDILLTPTAAVREIQFALERGFKLRGVLLDRTGGRFGGARLHFLREARTNTFAVDSWVKTAEDGSFLSPTLPYSPTYMIKLQTVDRSVISVVEHQVTVPSPPPAEINVGLIGPMGTVARFRLPEERPPGRYTLVVSATGHWQEKPRSMAIANATFDAQDESSIAGLPPGTLSWSLLRALPDGREVSVGSGTAKLTETEARVPLSLDAPPDYSNHGVVPRVHAPRGGPSPVDVVLLLDGAIKYATTAPADGEAIKLPSKLPRGAYEVLLRQGTRFGRFPLPVPGTAPVFLIADQAGEPVAIHVVRDAQGIPGATITVRGLDVVPGARARRGWTIAADKDGRAVLHVPPGCKQLFLGVVDPRTRAGSLKTVELTPNEAVTIELR